MQTSSKSQHKFVRNEYLDPEGNWVQMAGTRLPDNKNNRAKLERDRRIMSANGMKIRTIQYEIHEVINAIISPADIPVDNSSVNKEESDNRVAEAIDTAAKAIEESQQSRSDSEKPILLYKDTLSEKLRKLLLGHK